LCQQAEIVGIDADVDPDSMFEDIDVALADKLRVESGSLTSTLCDGIADMSSLPVINIIDIYNYLMTFSQYDHATLRHYYKMEGYTMHQDGFVIDLQTVLYADHPDYVAVKSKVKPRTKDKDTRTHLTYYCVWIIFVNVAVIQSHQYNYQMQMQMAIMGLSKCHLVLYTYKGICAVDVDYNDIM
jgi:hypothetical protein